MGVSKNNGTPKSSILIGFSIINHLFWGTPIFGNIQMGIEATNEFQVAPLSASRCFGKTMWPLPPNIAVL